MTKIIDSIQREREREGGRERKREWVVFMEDFDYLQNKIRKRVGK